MTHEQRRITIGELCDRGDALIQTGPFGSQLHSHEYREFGTPVVPTEAIGRRRISLRDLPRVSEEVAARLARHKLIAGDILFARRGAQATGSSALVERSLEGGLCGTGAILLRVRNRNEVDPVFLSFALCAQSSIQWLKYHAVGAVMPNLNSDVIRRLSIPLPPLDDQLAIAGFLGALDAKIELNAELNETLEAMARALFKSWFVDFDPVHAKAAGRAPIGMDAETAKLFPSEFVDSDLGPIPKGWRSSGIGELVELAYGKALRKDLRSTGKVPVYGSGGHDGSHDEAFVVGPGIVVGRKGTVGSVYWVDADFFPIDTTFFVRLIGSASLRWVYEQLRSMNIASLGADSAVPGVNRNAIYAQRWVLPQPETMKAYELLIAPLVERQRLALQEVETLAELRDELLPRLLSGELKVAA